MSRISNLTKYPYDYNVTENDFVIGTDGDNKKTKNFPVVALAEYVRNFNNNLSYDRVISIGEITSENNNITINVNNLGNVVYINHTFYTKNTPDTFTFTPVTEGVKIILLYALPDEQIFYMLEGVQSIEAVEPTLPSGALFVQRIIVTVNGIEIIPNDIIISDNKVQITENTNFAQIGQTQKDFNRSLQSVVTGKQDKLNSYDESILIEDGGNIEGNISLFQEYFEQQNCVLNFTPIQIIGVYVNGIKQKPSSYTITLPKTITIVNFTSGDYIEIQYTKLKI